MLNNIKIALFTLTALASTTAAIAQNHVHQQNDDQHQITIIDPWIRSAPANAPALGLFLKISNNTNQEVRLVSVHTPGYKRIELHRTINNNGMMKMVKQDFMPIPAQGKLHLKPGSWHVMLIGPNRVPGKGEKIELSLEFNNGNTQTIQALVRKGKRMMQHHSAH